MIGNGQYIWLGEISSQEGTLFVGSSGAEYSRQQTEQSYTLYHRYLSYGLIMQMLSYSTKSFCNCTAMTVRLCYNISTNVQSAIYYYKFIGKVTKEQLVYVLEQNT